MFEFFAVYIEYLWGFAVAVSVLFSPTWCWLCQSITLIILRYQLKELELLAWNAARNALFIC